MLTKSNKSPRLDSAILNNIAFEDPYLWGDGVLMAQMLLDAIVLPPVPSARLAAPEEQMDELIKQQITLFPNPTQSEFNILIEGFESVDGIQIEIFSIIGKQLSLQNISSNITNINLNNWESGTYIYRICNKDALLQQGKIVLIK